MTLQPYLPPGQSVGYTEDRYKRLVAETAGDPELDLMTPHLLRAEDDVEALDALGYLIGQLWPNATIKN